MIISTNTDKSFDKIQHHFMIKTLNNFFNLIHKIFMATSIKSPQFNIIFTGERPDVFCLKSVTKQECLPSPLLFNIILEVLARAVRQENKFKTSGLERKK